MALQDNRMVDEGLTERIVTFIKPLVEDRQRRQRYVTEALRGSAALEYLDWDETQYSFADHLVHTVETWGTVEDLCQLVNGLAHRAGAEQETANELCTVIRKTRTSSFFAGRNIDGRYTLDRKLGEGGNGEVWSAIERLPDNVSTRRVAIKLLKREVSENSQRIDRFKKEISVASRLNHPNIIRTTSWGEFRGHFYAVMDYIEGQTLRDFIAGRTFSYQETARYLGQMAQALDAAHSKGFVHRDVKPENILVHGEQLFLGDFGLAISPHEDLRVTRSGEFVGTKKYMAPEQWHNKVTGPQTDIYALGIIAYEMLTGTFPFDVSSPMILLTQHLDIELPQHDALPPDLLQILRRAAAKRLADRYANATEFITDLKHWELAPEILETRIKKYLNQQRSRIRWETYEQISVPLEGDIRPIPAMTRATDPADSYADSFLDEFVIELVADHHAPDNSESTYVPNILDRLTQSEKVVLVGEPGAGKTFTLRRLMMHYISNYDTLQRVPVFIPLNAFKGKSSFIEYIKQQMGELSSYYGQLMQEGRLVLICDALNEMPRTAPAPEERELLPGVRAVLKGSPLFVVSCRIRDYRQDLDDLGLEWLKVRDMDLPTIKSFIHNYLSNRGPDFWQRLGGSEALLSLWHEMVERGETELFWREENGPPGYASHEQKHAWRKMWQAAKLLPLARKPYLAGLICWLHHRQQLPTRHAELYEAFVTRLYEREHRQHTLRGQPFPPLEELEAFLAELASQLQAQHTTILKYQQLPGSEELQAALNATLLVLDGEDLRFTHQLLQEYFSAKALRPGMLANDDPRPIFGRRWWQLSAWRETAMMLVELTGETESVARWIGRASPELALEILQHFQAGTMHSDTRQLITASAMIKLKESSPIGRAAAYRVLGRFNADQRPGTSIKRQHGQQLPDIQWRPIPGGTFQYGGEGEPDNPLQELTLPPFEIARYPITYAQFQCFVEAPDFKNERWWAGMPAEEEAGGKRHPTRDLSDQAFKYWNHPRERVSWYQAVAFCRWLSDKLGFEISLPTEQQWERAARGPDGRLYPFGEIFDPARANTYETGIHQTSAVGIFPDGASPEGVQDICGNVWEWCLNQYRKPEITTVDASGARRVLRGGSWPNIRSFARAAYRTHNAPNSRSGSVGFRVVRLAQ